MLPPHRRWWRAGASSVIIVRFCISSATGQMSWHLVRIFMLPGRPPQPFWGQNVSFAHMLDFHHKCGCSWSPEDGDYWLRWSCGLCCRYKISSRDKLCFSHYTFSEDVSFQATVLFEYVVILTLWPQIASKKHPRWEQVNVYTWPEFVIVSFRCSLSFSSVWSPPAPPEAVTGLFGCRSMS